MLYFENDYCEGAHPAILQKLADERGHIVTYDALCEAVWGADYNGEVKIVDVNIRRLRIKIEDNTGNPTYITTVWGFGYKWGV